MPNPPLSSIRASGVILVTLSLLLGVILLGVGLGSVSIDGLTSLKAIWHGLNHQPLSPLEGIVWQMRFPRVMMGLLVGASLGISGAAYQGIFRNPLADPYLMGVASGGACGATIAVMGQWPQPWIPLAGFVGACISVAATLLLAKQGSRFPTNRLILAGVVVGAILSAVSSYILLSGQDRLREVMAWTMGNLSLSGWSEAQAVLPYAAVGMVVLYFLAKPLNTLQLGDATAYSLGVPVERLRLLVILASTLATAAAVSYAGIIGFVGLVTPHILRRLLGNDFRWLLPISALSGGMLLILADLLARTVVRPQELPVGIITTLLGGPFFLYLLRKNP